MSARHNGPSLPKSLLEELDNVAAGAPGHKRKGGKQLSRKEARKQERDEHKQRKANYFSQGRPQVSKPTQKRSAENEHSESPQRKKAKTDLSVSKPSREVQAAPVNTPKDKASSSARSSKDKPKLKTALEKLASKQTEKKGSIVALPRTRDEEEEDARIAYYERKLGWAKGGKRTTKYGKGGDDGLDDLLQDLDVLEDIGHNLGAKSDDEDMAEDIEDEENSEDEDEVDSNSEEDEGRIRPSDQDGDGSPEEEENVDEEWGGFGAGEDTQHKRSVPAASEAEPVASGSRYVPPPLRNRAQDGPLQESEAQVKLTRQLKGLLNRMSEQNMSSIIDGVEEIYRNHRRHDVTSTITTLIIDGISSHSILLDSYVVLHAAFVSALHKIVGIEFAAHFVQNVISSYERHFADVQEPSSAAQADDAEPLGKECSNLIVLLSELYNFQVISCVLVYDIIRALLDGALTEFKVELLLKLTRNSGQQLRQDDPSALKSVIQIVQGKLPADASALSSRTRFMVETLTNLKNNKVKHDAGQSGGGEAVDRMKKFLSGLSKRRHVLAHEPLRVSLQDLHSAESKGKWWLVGAAWGGDPLAERHAQKPTEAAAPREDALLALARKQGMNTEIRRGVFVVLMSSEDYVDACERLAQLRLTETQQRELLRVLLHCCGNEKVYNPYYALIGQQLCRTAHAHRITLQFCLWDFLRDLGEAGVGGAELLKSLGDTGGFGVKHISTTRMRNTAKAYAWWIARDCCALAILKPVDFTTLKPQTKTFFKELFTQLFVASQVSTPLLSSDPKDFPATRNKGAIEEIFIKATKLQALVIGLVYFLGEAFKGDDGFVKWASDVARETLRTGLDAVAHL